MTLLRARMQKQRFFLIGERIVKTAIAKEGIGCGNCHQFVNVQLAGPLNTTTHERFAQTTTLEVSVHGQALQFSHLSRIDFQRNKADNRILRFRNESVNHQSE